MLMLLISSPGICSTFVQAKIERRHSMEAPQHLFMNVTPPAVGTRQGKASNVQWNSKLGCWMVSGTVSGVTARFQPFNAIFQSS